MYRCFACCLTFSNSKNLILHVELTHITSSYFQCLENGCLKKFFIFDSYKQHMTTDRNCHLNLKSYDNHTSAEESGPFDLEKSVMDSTDMVLCTDSDSS